MTAARRAVLLSNGKVLVTPVDLVTPGTTALFDPVSNSISPGPLLPYNDVGADEQSAVKLPDDSILTFDKNQRGERYIPSLNEWVEDGDTLENLRSNPGGELGADFLLPDGNAFMIGGDTNTAIYEPSGNTNAGTWKEGPAMPDGLAAPDAPAAMMSNGKILCVLSRAPYTLDGTNFVFSKPCYFYEYDYSAGTLGAFTQIHAPNGGYTNDEVTFNDRMLDLPDGTVLFTDGGTKLYVYKPGGSPLPAGQPAIGSVSWNANGSLHLSGTYHPTLGWRCANNYRFASQFRIITLFH